MYKISKYIALACIFLGLATPVFAYAPELINPIKIQKVLLGTITAYASVEWMTDSTPFLTAYGTQTREGIVANNCSPKGTLILIDGIQYVVEDRFHSRFNDRCDKFDIWMASVQEAQEFGIQEKEVTILE